MEFRKVLIYFLCILVSSCNGIEDEVVPTENIIELKVYDFDGNLIVGDDIGNGETIITLKAQIPVNAKADSRTVKFRASDGAVFQGIGDNVDTEIANAEGVATTTLKLPLYNGPVFLSAEVTSGGNIYTSEKKLNLTGVADVIQLKVYNLEETTEITEAIGNGDDLVVLKAFIPENTKTDSRTVKFSASNGAVFQGVGGNVDTKIANMEGVATTTLKLPLDNNPVFFSAEVTIGENTYTSEKRLNLIGVDEVVTLELLNADGSNLSSSLRADGFTLIRLKATVNYNQDVFNQVTFEKSSGDFQNISDNNVVQDLDDENKGFLDLRLPVTKGRIYLSAKVGPNTMYFDEEVIDLLGAFPDEIIIEPTNVNMTENSSNMIDVFLTRENGKVSKETEAEFKSFQLVNGDEVEVGRFTGLENADTDMDGKITVQFKTDTGDFDISLPVIIRVSSRNDLDESIQSTVSINLN